MNKILFPLIAGILVLSIGLSQDVYAPDDKPEKLLLGGTGYNSDTGNFEITALVKIPKDSELRDGYTVDTTIELFKPDGTPIRASLSSTGDQVPTEGVGKGGENNSVHKLLIQIFYEPPEELSGEKVRIKITAELFDSYGNKVSTAVKYANITLKRG